MNQTVSINWSSFVSKNEERSSLKPIIKQVFFKLWPSVVRQRCAKKKQKHIDNHVAVAVHVHNSMSINNILIIS